MTKTEFEKEFIDGSENAINTLKNSDNPSQYKNIIVKHCLESITNREKIIKSNGDYIYSAIDLLEEKDEIKNIIIKNFQYKLEYKKFSQLLDILHHYVLHGSRKAYRAILDSYLQLSEKLPNQIIFSMSNSDIKKFESLMIKLIEINGWPAFGKLVNDAGCIISSCDHEDFIYFDMYIKHCEEIFGKEIIWTYFEKFYMKNPNIKSFVDANIKFKNLEEEIHIV